MLQVSNLIYSDRVIRLLAKYIWSAFSRTWKIIKQVILYSRVWPQRHLHGPETAQNPTQRCQQKHWQRSLQSHLVTFPDLNIGTYVCVCHCVYVGLSVSTSVSVSPSVTACMSVRSSVTACVSVRLYVHVCTSVCMCTCVRSSVCASVYVRLYVRVCFETVII